MASYSDEECLVITSEMYQEIIRRAAHDYNWTHYFLLINACLENLRQMPATPEQREHANAEELLIDCIDRLADMIATILPGGIDEFRSYLTQAVHREQHRTTTKLYLCKN